MLRVTCCSTALLHEQKTKTTNLYLFFFSGEPNESNELLTWLLYQMKEDTIENINRDLLALLVEKQDFLAVIFCKEKKKC